MIRQDGELFLRARLTLAAYIGNGALFNHKMKTVSYFHFPIKMQFCWAKSAICL